MSYKSSVTMAELKEAQAIYKKLQLLQTAGEYKYVGSVEARDLTDISYIGNLGGMPQGARSLSVGDIIKTPTGETMIVAPFGFDELFTQEVA